MARTSRDPPRSEAATTRERSVGADRTDSPDRPRRVGVLSRHNSKETKAILNAVRALGHDPVWIRDENATSWIEDGTVRIRPEVDVLINRLLVTKSDRKLEELQIAALYGSIAPVVNPPDAVERTLHKFRAGAQLAAAGLPVPDAFFGLSPRTLDEWGEHLPGTAAHKQTIGTNGRQMAIVSPDEPVTPRIGDEQSFVQEFLDDGDDRPSDVRVYVVGDRVVGEVGVGDRLAKGVA